MYNGDMIQEIYNIKPNPVKKEALKILIEIEFTELEQKKLFDLIKEKKIDNLNSYIKNELLK